MIYGRFGDEVTLVRRGTLEDVKQLDKRKPDKQDKECVESHSYVVIRREDGQEILSHVGFLRADGGFKEIGDEMQRLGFPL